MSELIVWSTDCPSQAEQHQKQQEEYLAQRPRIAAEKPSEKHNGELTSTKVAKNKRGRRKKRIAAAPVESAASTTATTSSEQGDKLKM